MPEGGNGRAQTTWRIFRRHDAKSPWVSSVVEQSEHNGRSALERYRRDYPQYEWELRKLTTTVERVDA